MAKKSEKNEGAQDPQVVDNSAVAVDPQTVGLATEPGVITQAEAPKVEEPAPVQTAPAQPQVRMYTPDEVRAMLEQVAANLGQKKDDKKPVQSKNKTLRLARFHGKFIVGFVNKNTDPFLPNKVVHAFNIWNPEKKENVAWITLRYDDNSTEDVPLAFIVENADPVECEILEVMKEDKSYSLGKVERREIRDYHPEGTGIWVEQEVRMYKPSFKIRLPDGREMVVGDDVINFR